MFSVFILDFQIDPQVSLQKSFLYYRKIWRKYIKPNCLQQIFQHLFSLIFIIFPIFPIFPISYSEVFYEFLEIRIPSCEKFISLQTRIKSSLRHCKRKKEKETRSFPSRNPFILYSFLVCWLSERYKILESFAGIIGCNKHLCFFLALTQRCSSQKRGIATLGKLHQLADKNLLFGRGRYVV